MKNNIFVTSILFIILGYLILMPTNTEAACKSDEYLNSNNQCLSLIITNNKQSILLDIIKELQALIVKLKQQQEIQATSDAIDISTRKVESVSYDKAKLTGEVKFKNSKTAVVYFEYGQDKLELNSKSNQKTIDKKDGSKTFSFNIDDLKKDTIYYYRAVGEDENGKNNYGSIYSFKTGVDSLGGKLPSVKTGKFDNVDNHEAEIDGAVNMYNYEHGIVFFVYGESKSRVEKISHDYDKYVDVTESEKDLKKVSVDNDLSSHVSYGIDLTGLTKDTKIYYAMCLEFTDEDGNQDISCGETEAFKTND